jgi:hypothetical protein
MEITCPCYNKKFEPFFTDECEIRTHYRYNPPKVEDKSCICPYCHISIRLSELSDYDQMQVQVEEMKRNNEEYEDDSA